MDDIDEIKAELAALIAKQEKAREGNRIASKRWRANNPEKAAQHLRKWDAAHPEKIKLAQLKYYRKVRAKLTSERRQFYLENPAQCRREKPLPT